MAVPLHKSMATAMASVIPAQQAMVLRTVPALTTANSQPTPDRKTLMAMALVMFVILMLTATE